MIHCRPFHALICWSRSSIHKKTVSFQYRCLDWKSRPRHYPCLFQGWMGPSCNRCSIASGLFSGTHWKDPHCHWPNFHQQTSRGSLWKLTSVGCLECSLSRRRSLPCLSECSHRVTQTWTNACRSASGEAWRKADARAGIDIYLRRGRSGCLLAG